LINKKLDLPRFLQLYQLLKAEIISGKYACYEPIPSQQQLIDAYQVSLITVRRAIEKLSAEGYILRRQGKGCFVAPATDWQINRSQVLQIGVIVSSIANSFFPEIIEGMEQYLHTVNAQLTISHSQWQAAHERSHINSFLRNGCHGLLISPSQDCQAYRKLQEEGVPFVFFNHYFPDAGFPYVITDDRNGVKAAIDHLIARGHRRIGAVIGGSGKATALDRLAGLRDSFAAAGLEWKDSWLSWQKNFTYDEGVEGARELFAREPALTAIFCSSELLATGTAAYLLNRGYRIPEQMSLVAFGDSDTSRFFKIPLTTIAQPTTEMGATAARLLVEAVQDRPVDADQIVLPCRLIIRESTAQARNA
jgi:DNA-binding LacI/PurR family transcriptional regulator